MDGRVIVWIAAASAIAAARKIRGRGDGGEGGITGGRSAVKRDGGLRVRVSRNERVGIGRGRPAVE